MAGWIDDHGNGSDAVRQIEGKSGRNDSSQLFHFLAAGRQISHLDIDDAVERADLALGDP